MDEPLQEATHTGELEIGEISIQCHVLEDGTRLVSQGSFLKAIGRTGSPTKAAHTSEDGSLQLPVFLGAKNLQPFVTKDVSDTFKPVYFKGKSAGAYSIGYRAESLPKVCHIYLDAKEADKLHRTQEATADRCKILSRGFSEVGIAALSGGSR